MDMTRRTFTLAAAATAAAVAAPLAAKTAKMDDVLVLGAGISGLNSARQLEAQGLKVTVLEGRQRVGGRIYTLFDVEGYPEMGFNSMGEGYGRGLDAASWAGVEMVDVAQRFYTGKPQALWLNGKHMTREEWAAFPGNPFPAELKTVMPWELLNALVAKHNRLTDWLAWLDPANAKLDISVHEFLKTQGLSDAAIQLACDTSPYYGTNSYDASALMLEFNQGFIATQIAAGKKVLAVKGGNMNLPIAMAKKLKGPVLLGKEVVAIDNQPDAVDVRCADGSVYRAKQLICSLPFSALRHVHITPALTGKQAQAVATLPYQPITIAMLQASEPFWETDGLSPNMWTDGFSGWVAPQRFGANPADVTGLMVQGRGNLSKQWDRLGKDAAMQRVIATIEAMRPSARGKLKAVSYHSWSGEYFNGGDIAYYSPGQIAAFVADMGAAAGRIHFCGEHLATGARGLEGALETSERAVLEILSA
ncbi:flavin monoamine oxidase family protein [Sandaracinobacteroides hominis]|uniref:flavin monoamine oxidase family protein n=1 Tax=Sandaracinobacteroides hominis TaxID=2780086 RepID=UPI001F2F7DAB|nr:NAD(P)/FAD-dependent oxidoreductase [Sandaracinobacteroides hominis]